MRICIEVMFQMLFLGISCLVLVELILFNNYIQEGRNYLHLSVDRIETSEDYEKTAELCAAEAENKGYTLTWSEIKEKTQESGQDKDSTQESGQNKEGTQESGQNKEGTQESGQSKDSTQGCGLLLTLAYDIKVGDTALYTWAVQAYARA